MQVYTKTEEKTAHIWNINDRHRPCWIRNDVYVIYIAAVHDIYIVCGGEESGRYLFDTAPLPRLKIYRLYRCFWNYTRA